MILSLFAKPADSNSVGGGGVYLVISVRIIIIRPVRNFAGVII